MPNITPQQFYNYLVQNIGKYSTDVQNKVRETTKEVSDKIKPEVQSYSVKGKQLYRTGAYRAGWRVTTLTKNGVYRRKVYNKSKPTLVHLLEFGHGGPFPARAYPHVSPTELKYQEILFKKVKEIVERV